MIRRILYLLLVTVILGGLGGAIAFYAFDFKPKMLATVILGRAACRPRRSRPRPPAPTPGSRRSPASARSPPSRASTSRRRWAASSPKINFESGEDVPKGKLLVKLDTATEEADMRSIAAELVQYRDATWRAARSWPTRAWSRVTELDTLKTRKRVLEATLDRRRAEVAQKFIYAPWDGRVGLKDIALGSYLAPGQKIVWLQKIDPVFVDFTVTETDYGRISLGQKVTATFNAYPGESFTGKIATTDARVSDTSRMITVRAEIANPDRKLVPGMYANVLVDSGKTAAGRHRAADGRDLFALWRQRLRREHGEGEGQGRQGRRGARDRAPLRQDRPGARRPRGDRKRAEAGRPGGHRRPEQDRPGQQGGDRQFDRLEGSRTRTQSSKGAAPCISPTSS